MGFCGTRTQSRFAFILDSPKQLRKVWVCLVVKVEHTFANEDHLLKLYMKITRMLAASPLHETLHCGVGRRRTPLKTDTQWSNCNTCPAHTTSASTQRKSRVAGCVPIKLHTFQTVTPTAVVSMHQCVVCFEGVTVFAGGEGGGGGSSTTSARTSLHSWHFSRTA